jgi:predicted transcriptional regulator
VLSLASIHVSPASLLKILLAQFKNRGRIGIVVDIMDTVRRTHPHGRTKTQIMRGARLSYDQTCRYLDFLMMCDYIRGQKIQKGDRELVSYSLTLQGFELYRQLYTLHSAMELLEQKFV